MELINEVMAMCKQAIDAGEVTRKQLIADAIGMMAVPAVIIGFCCHFMYWMQVMTMIMDVKQTAEYLGVSTKTIYRWVKRDYIPYVRLGTYLLRFDSGTLDNWIKKEQSALR